MKSKTPWGCLTAYIRLSLAGRGGLLRSHCMCTGIFSVGVSFYSMLLLKLKQRCIGNAEGM